MGMVGSSRREGAGLASRAVKLLCAFAEPARSCHRAGNLLPRHENSRFLEPAAVMLVILLPAACLA